MQEIGMVYEGPTEEQDPVIEDGSLVGYDLNERVEIDLEDGDRLVPGFATAAGEDQVIRVYREE